MDSFDGFDAKRMADTTALLAPLFPTADEIDAHVRRARQLRAETMGAIFSTAFKAFAGSFSGISDAFARWQKRMQDKEKLLRRSDRLLADIGVERHGIDAFLESKQPVHQAGDTPIELPKGLLTRIEAMRKVRQEQKRIENELSAYEDRELDDIGIHRADIPRIARGEQKIAA